MVDIVEIIRSLIDLVSVSIPLTIVLMIGTLVGLFFFNFFQKKFQWKWLGSSLASCLVLFSIILVIIHAANLFTAISLTDVAAVPADIRNDPLYQEDLPNPLLLFFSAIVQSILSGIILSLISLPFTFAGVAVFDALKPKMKGVWSRLAVVCFLASIVLIILLGIFPWLLVSLVYMIYWGW